MSFQFLTLVACTAGMAFVGLVYNTSPVYFMVAALIAVLVVSYAAARVSARSLAWRRETSDRVFDGDPITVTAEIRSRGRLPHFLLTVSDILPEFIETDQPPEFVLPTLWPGQRIRLSYQARALKRGVYRLGPLRASISDPFGVFTRSVQVPVFSEAVVYPRPVPLTGLIARSGAQVGAAIGERSRSVESGLEFYSVRDYQPGDELRRIHWPATARHGKLTVIEYERGISTSLSVVLDARAGTEFGAGLDTSLEVAVRVAASLVRWVLESHGAVSLAADSADGPRWLPADGVDREHQLLEMLARLQANGTMPVSSLLEWVGRRVPLGGTACVVTAAPDPDLPAAVRSLCRQQVRVVVLLLDAETFDPRARAPMRAEELTAAGAITATIARGDDLRDALRPAFSTNY